MVSLGDMRIQKRAAWRGGRSSGKSTEIEDEWKISVH